MDQLETQVDNPETEQQLPESVDTVPPPTSPNAAADDELSTLRQLTKSAIEREQRLQAELDAMRMANQPKPVVEDVTEEEFQAKPFDTLKKLIAAQNAPLRSFVEEQRRVAQFNNEFNTYVQRVPALAPYAESIRAQLAQSLISSDTPINQSVIDVHTNALIGRMVLQSNLTAPAAPAQPTANGNSVVPPTPPRPRTSSVPADSVKLTESQLRAKKSLDPDGKIWPDNKSFLEYLNAEERVIPL